MSMLVLQLLAATTLTVQNGSAAVAHPHHTTHVSNAAIALAVAGGVLVCACLAWAISRALTLEPRWLLSLRHASAEATARVSATWAEFSDWARLGR